MARLQFDIDGDDALKMTTVVHLPDGYIEIKDVSHKPRPGIDLYLSQYTSPGRWIPISEIDAALIACMHEMRRILQIGGYCRFCCPVAEYPNRPHRQESLQCPASPPAADRTPLSHASNEHLSESANSADPMAS